MPSALYYPNWSISNTSFLSSSLLLWDSLYCIVPFREFRPGFTGPHRRLNVLLEEAHDLYIKGYVPSKAEQNELYHTTERLVRDVPFEKLRIATLTTPSDPYTIAAAKLGHKTRQLLLESEWAKPSDIKGMIDLHEALGLVIMGQLVNVCAGRQLPPITDQTDPYRMAARLLIAPSRDLPKEESDSRTLVQIAVPRLVPRLPRSGTSAELLRRVLRARQDAGCEELRISFQKTVSSYLERLRTAEVPAERSAIIDEYVRALERDGRLLKTELRAAGLDALLTKDSLVGIVAGAAAGAYSPVVGGAVALGAVWRGYTKERRKTLERHWTSFLYGLRPTRFSLW